MKRISLAALFLLSVLLVTVTSISSAAPQTPNWGLPVHPWSQGARLSQQEDEAPQPDPSKPRPPSSQRSNRTASKAFEEAIEGMERIDGLFTLYQDKENGKLFAEIKREQLNTHYLCTVTMESGLGESGIYSGLPLADFLFNFQRVNNRLQFVVPNLYFRTAPGDPLQRSVQRSFSNSVLQTLPIRAVHAQRKSLLIDLSPLFLSDLPGITPILSLLLGASYNLDANKSHFSMVKAFPQNVELESVYGFSTSSSQELPAFVLTLPDSRAFNLNVRYSLSQLPTGNGYRPRLADDRVGYFITAYQNLSDNSPRTPFVRYINRWHLEKQDPTLPLSPPKRPITFWIENTVPVEYRDAVRDGILMWNKAFEKIGFKDAIQVQQMPDNATWDPADVRYNTIRWLTTFDSGFLGIGPSRVNPLTGEILDADILIEASFARYLKQQYQSLVQQNRSRLMASLTRLTGNPNLCSYGMDSQLLEQEAERKATQAPRSPLVFQMLGQYDLCYSLEATRQVGVGSMALSMLRNVLPNDGEMQTFVQQFLRMLIAHEVGHTLGLRHNFRASALLSPSQLNDRSITREKGLVGSVMDYSAVNLAPEGTPQGDYFTQSVGPYDEWAIAYGYTPSDARTPQSETRFLDTIARQAAQPEHAYATDEDAFARLDPTTNVFDLSSDLLTYAPWQLENAIQMWQRLEKRYPTEGQSYNDVRVIFDEILDYYFQYSRFLTQYVGGQSFNRYRSGDTVGRLPFEPIPLEKQRQALKLLQKYVFDETRFHFSPTLINKLAPSRWSHWGADLEYFNLEYPVYDRVLLLQTILLRDLLSGTRLARLRDAELRTRADQVLTIPELINTLQTDIWREVYQGDRSLKLSSLRRGLQRQYLNQLTAMVLRQSSVPEDARSVAWYELKQLRAAIDQAIRRRSGEMDVYTKAHLEETRDRLTKVLNSQLEAQ